VQRRPRRRADEQETYALGIESQVAPSDLSGRVRLNAIETTRCNQARRIEARRGK